ncbi:MAG TPA: HAD family hydrolase [Candidatus Brocadiales bacterium]|nr:HAD family hydrolase [Candidatus Brocadiales bacterium]
MKKAVFLDRDGTIIHGVPYLSSPEELVLLPNSARAIRLFKEEGFTVVIATNQSGVARGYFTEQRLHEIHERLLDLLSQEGATIDAVYYCPHLPEGTVAEYSIECQCRKPKTGMLLRAAREHGINLKGSIMIGDTPGDILAGNAVGCKTVLVKNHEEEIDMPVEADLVVRDIWKAAQILCSRAGQGVKPVL